jgi:chromosome segregation ATPase
MDAESLAQVERIVTTAVSGVEGRLRDEMQALRGDLGEKIVAAERHAGALFEEALHRIDLVVEGHQALNQKIERLETKIERLETKMEHEFLEMRALIQLSYRQLQERVETLEQRVQFIEKRLGLSA